MLDLPLEIFANLRTRQVLSVASTAQAVVRRILDDPMISGLIEFHEYTALHFREKELRFHHRQNFTSMLPRLAKEPRAIISVGNMALTFTCSLLLNCSSTLVTEKVGGKRREVPEKADCSFVRVRFSGEAHFTPVFLDCCLRLIGDCFGLIGGDYGWARNIWTKIWTNDYDERYGDLFAPHFLTWANLFGPQHVASIGRERFQTAHAHACVDLPGGGILLAVCADPRDFTSPHVQDTVTRVKRHLGILAPSARATREELAAFGADMQTSIPPSASQFAEAFRQAAENTPGEMARQAEGVVEGVKRFWAVRLDYTPASFSVVDELILTAFRPDEESKTVVQAFGAYLGECVRRHCGGSWWDEAMKGQPVLLDVGPKQQRIDPFRAVQQRFEKRETGVPLPEWWNSIGK